MKRALACSLVLMLVVASGCGDSRESLAADSVATMKDLVATFESMKDQASAKAAKSKLKSLIEKMNDLKARQSKLGMPTEAEFKSLEAKYGNEMEQLSKKLTNEMLRIRFDPAISREIEDLDVKMK